MRGVIDQRFVGGNAQTARGGQVVVNLDVGRVPDLIAARHRRDEPFHVFPVALGAHFVRMAPDVEQRLRPLGIERAHELLGQRQRVFMVAGGMPGEKVLGQAEFHRVLRGAAVEHAAGAQRVFRFIRIGAAGIGHPHDGITGGRLERAAVVHDFRDERGGGHLVHPAVADGVAGDLVPGVQAAHLRPALVGKIRAVDVEGALDAIAVEQRDKALVVFVAVVIAECHDALFAAGIAVKLNHTDKTSFPARPPRRAPRPFESFHIITAPPA